MNNPTVNHNAAKLPDAKSPLSGQPNRSSKLMQSPSASHNYIMQNARAGMESFSGERASRGEGSPGQQYAGTNYEIGFQGQQVFAQSGQRFFSNKMAQSFNSKKSKVKSPPGVSPPTSYEITGPQPSNTNSLHNYYRVDRPVGDSVFTGNSQASEEELSLKRKIVADSNASTNQTKDRKIPQGFSHFETHTQNSNGGQRDSQTILPAAGGKTPVISTSQHKGASGAKSSIVSPPREDGGKKGDRIYVQNQDQYKVPVKIKKSAAGGPPVVQSQNQKDLVPSQQPAYYQKASKHARSKQGVQLHKQNMSSALPQNVQSMVPTPSYSKHQQPPMGKRYTQVQSFRPSQTLTSGFGAAGDHESQQDQMRQTIQFTGSTDKKLPSIAKRSSAWNDPTLQAHLKHSLPGLANQIDQSYHSFQSQPLHPQAGVFTQKHHQLNFEKILQDKELKLNKLHTYVSPQGAHYSQSTKNSNLPDKGRDYFSLDNAQRRSKYPVPEMSAQQLRQSPPNMQNFNYSQMQKLHQLNHQLVQGMPSPSKHRNGNSEAYHTISDPLSQKRGLFASPQGMTPAGLMDGRKPSPQMHQSVYNMYCLKDEFVGKENSQYMFTSSGDQLDPQLTHQQISSSNDQMVSYYRQQQKTQKNSQLSQVNESTHERDFEQRYPASKKGKVPYSTVSEAKEGRVHHTQTELGTQNSSLHGSMFSGMPLPPAAFKSGQVSKQGEMRGEAPSSKYKLSNRVKILPKLSNSKAGAYEQTDQSVSALDPDNELNTSKAGSIVSPQNMSTIQGQFGKRKISSTLTNQEKQKYKDQFDTFRNIYQIENLNNLTRSIDSNDSALSGIRHPKGFKQSQKLFPLQQDKNIRLEAHQLVQDPHQEQQYRTMPQDANLNLKAQRGDGSSQPIDDRESKKNPLNSHVLTSPQFSGRQPGSKDEMGRGFNGSPQGEPNSPSALHQQNEARLQQVKQFIYMVDLFNVIEQESRQNMGFNQNSPPADGNRPNVIMPKNVFDPSQRSHPAENSPPPPSESTVNLQNKQYSQSSGMYQQAFQIEQRKKIMNLINLQESHHPSLMRQQQLTSSIGLLQQYFVSALLLTQVQMKLDDNIWKHFSNLMKKSGYLNGYLRDSILKKASQLKQSNLSYQEIQKNLKAYLQELEQQNFSKSPSKGQMDSNFHFQNQQSQSNFPYIMPITQQMSPQPANQLYHQSGSYRQHQYWESSNGIAANLNAGSPTGEFRSPNESQANIGPLKNQMRPRNSRSPSQQMTGTKSTNAKGEARVPPGMISPLNNFSNTNLMNSGLHTETSVPGFGGVPPNFQQMVQGSLSNHSSQFQLHPSMQISYQIATNNPGPVHHPPPPQQPYLNTATSGFGLTEKLSSPSSFNQLASQSQQHFHQSPSKMMNSTSKGAFPAFEEGNQIPMQISSTLFIMDCQTFGILNNQKLLKLGSLATAAHGNHLPGEETDLGAYRTREENQHNQSYSPNLQNGGKLGPIMGSSMGSNNPSGLSHSKKKDSPSKQIPVKLTEAQVINFVMSKTSNAQQHQQQASTSYSGLAINQMPKLSEESKRILNTIKAQQHLRMGREIQKIDTLIIEMDYFDYKNQLLQSLFHLWGNKVLQNLVNKIEKPTASEKGSAGGANGAPNSTNFGVYKGGNLSSKKQQEKAGGKLASHAFQSIHEYIDKIRKHHDDSIKMANMQQQQLFSQINDFSSGNDGENNFESFDIKSHSATRNVLKPEAEKKKAEQLLMTRSSEALENQLNVKKKSSGGLEIIGHKQSAERILGKFNNQSRSTNGNNPVQDKINFENEKKNEDLELQMINELKTLFPKKYCKKTNRFLSSSSSSLDKKQREEEPREFVKVKKKINFHVIVKNTKMYEALKFMDKKRKMRNAREALKNDAEDGSKGPISIFSSDRGLALHDLSSFVQTKDPSILMFALYCAQAGIINSAQQLLGQFFKSIFIVIKPGSRILQDGSVQQLMELPKVDLDKINRYLIQSSLRKQISQANKSGQGMNKTQKHFNSPEPGPGQATDLKGHTSYGQFANIGSRNCLIDNQYNPNQVSGLNGVGYSGNPTSRHKGLHRFDIKHDKDTLRRNFSLNSFKSVKKTYDVKGDEPMPLSDKLAVDYNEHFNSGPCSIKQENPSDKTTIKIIHKPFTHLDNSRIQKCFKIYNEFIQLVFKNKQLFIQNQDMIQTQSEILKADINKIYKLAYHMGIRLPRRSNNNPVLGRTALLDTLKNHRSLMQIKEQMVRFVHRILNEENGLSHNFTQCVIMGQSIQNTNNLQSNQLVAVTGGSAIKMSTGELNIGQTICPPALLKDNDQVISFEGPGKEPHQLVSVGQFIAPNTLYYIYQVGFGNNHSLIKGLMRQRLWWHHIQRERNQNQQMQRLDFENSQIMWTQWRKQKLYQHLASHKSYREEFKEILQLVDDLKMQFVHAFERGEKSNNDRFNSSKAEKAQEKILKIYSQGPIQKAGANSVANFKHDQKDAPEKGSGAPGGKRKKGEKIRSAYKKTGGTDPASMEKIKKKNTLQIPQTEVKPLETESSPLRLRKEMDEDSNNGDTEADKGVSPHKPEHLTTEAKEEEKEEVPVPQIEKIDLKSKLEQCKKQMQKIYNKLEFNQHLNNKKALFINMRNYYTYCCDGKENVFNTLPLTFHVKTGKDDPEFLKFKQFYDKEQASDPKGKRNIWIIKPGENTNRGAGIKVEQELPRIQSMVSQYCSGQRTMILQKYIDNPLLYQKRKFDIRCFSLVTCHNGVMKAYFYRDGYIRTSSKEYNMNNLYNKYIHLVNDAVQKYSDDYGKYEPGNKLSYQELQRYFTATYPDKNINLERDIIMQIKKIVTDTIRATFHVLDSKKRLNTFELFGYDFMFDDQFKPYLIEVNSNPSLEPSSTLLTKLFSTMLDNTFRIAIDPLFPPNEGFSMKKGSIGIEICPENKFDLIFDERVDGPPLLKCLKQINKKEREEVESINELEGSEDGAVSDEEMDAMSAGDIIDKEEESEKEPDFEGIEQPVKIMLNENSNKTIKEMEEVSEFEGRA